MKFARPWRVQPRLVLAGAVLEVEHRKPRACVAGRSRAACRRAPAATGPWSSTDTTPCGPGRAARRCGIVEVLARARDLDAARVARPAEERLAAGVVDRDAVDEEPVVVKARDGRRRGDRPDAVGAFDEVGRLQCRARCRYRRVAVARASRSARAAGTSRGRRQRPAGYCAFMTFDAAGIGGPTACLARAPSQPASEHDSHFRIWTVCSNHPCRIPLAESSPISAATRLCKPGPYWAALRFSMRAARHCRAIAGGGADGTAIASTMAWSPAHPRRFATPSSASATSRRLRCCQHLLTPGATRSCTRSSAMTRTSSAELGRALRVAVRGTYDEYERVSGRGGCRLHRAAQFRARGVHRSRGERGRPRALRKAAGRDRCARASG